MGELREYARCCKAIHLLRRRAGFAAVTWGLGRGQDLRLSSMAGLLEPVIMAAMGLVVAAIVIVLYLPVFHLISIVP